MAQRLYNFKIQQMKTLSNNTYTYTTEKQQKQDDRDRLMIAARIMAGIIEQGETYFNVEHVAHKAIECADALIKASKR